MQCTKHHAVRAELQKAQQRTMPVKLWHACINCSCSAATLPLPKQTGIAALQVAVHNVPFKWCNDDLEELFRQQEGYLDAQLLFHENGRSKVGTLCAGTSSRAMQQRLPAYCV